MATQSSGDLLSTVKSFLTPQVLQQMTRHIEEPSDRVQSGVHTAIPALLAGVVQKGSSETGAKDLLGLIQRGGFDQVDPQGMPDRLNATSPETGQTLLSGLLAIAWEASLTSSAASRV